MGSRFSASTGGRQGAVFNLTDIARNLSVTAPTSAIQGSRSRHQTAPQVISKTFESYMRVRDRAEHIAKEKVESLNKMSLHKFKNQKKAENF